MALPRDKKERELFELRARVSQLESELSVVAGTLGDDECYDGDIAPGPMDIQMEEELVMEQEILIPQDYNESVDASVTSVEGDGGMDAQPTPSKKRIGRYPCSTCGRKFPFLSELKKHNNIHKPTEEREAIKKFECHICDKRFTWNCDLRRHQATHGEERPHTCTLCKAAFKLPEGLKKHMVLHSENSVKCTKCRRTYKDNDALQAHTCDRDGTYPCETCGKSFVRKDILAVHRRIHTGERPYICDVCSKGCITATKRKLHLVTHQNKPYTCTCCSKSFPTSLALQKHLQIGYDTWNERVCLIDVNVVYCKEDRALVQVEPTIEHQEDQLNNISEPSSETRSTQEQPTAQSNSTAQPSTWIPEPSSSTLIPPVGSGSRFKVPGSSVYVQLLSPLDKDNHPLHTQLPTAEGSTPDTPSTAAEGSTPDTPSTAAEGSTPDTPSTAAEGSTPDTPSTHNTTSNGHKLPHCLPSISIATFPDRLPPPCPFCGDTCEDADSLAEHMLVHMSPIPHRCTQCKVAYETSDDMDTHDCQEPTFDCATCSTSFPDYCALVAHILSAHVELALPPRKSHPAKAIQLPKKCRYCDQPFPSAHELTLHTNTEHSGTHPYKCTYCDKTFSKKQYLRAHTRSHTGEKHPHQCQLCDKHFTTAVRLKNHGKIHSKERPFKCQVCQREFLRQHLLKLHMRAHNGKKPYKCPHCSRRYHCPDGRQRHIENMHFGSMVNCELCNDNVAVEALDDHMLHTHKEAYQPIDPIDAQLPRNDSSSGESDDGSIPDSAEENDLIERSETEADHLVDSVPSDESQPMEDMSGGSSAGVIPPSHVIGTDNSRETTEPAATGASLKPIGRIGVGKDNARTVNVSAVVGPSSNLIGQSTDTTNKQPLFINIGGKLYARIT